jgi:class 3 adenylate cyclase
MFQKSAAKLGHQKKVANPFARFNSDIETILLNAECRPTELVYAEARERFEVPGCCLIVKFHTEGEAVDEDPILKLGITMYLRSVMESCVISASSKDFNDRAQLVKYDDERAFLFHENASVALRSACKANLVAKYINERLHKEKGVQITVTCGLEVGDLLLLVGDYYGDAVNVASKLGEDHAEPGQILLSIPCHDAIKEQDGPFLQNLRIEDGFVKISGVEIFYKSISMTDSITESILPQSSMPHCTTLASSTGNAVRRVCLQMLNSGDNGSKSGRSVIQEHKEYVTMLQSDMSGFTRLTKKYGILHFLTLVVHCRRIFKDCLGQNEGVIVKYDGDNVISKFPSPLHCLRAVKAIRAAVDHYNVGKEMDYQIRVKLGVSHGEVLIVGHDIVGDSWEDCCTLGEDTAEVGEVLVTTEVQEFLQRSQGNSKSCPQFLFEPREVETEHGILKHYNVTFPAEDYYWFL